MKNYIILFYILISFTINGQNLTQAEYYWDVDPGTGNAISLAVFDGNFDAALEDVFKNNAALPAVGNHVLGLRVKSNDGNWGVAYRKVFTVSANNNTNNLCQINHAEYFWDTDPGNGNGMVMLAFDGNFNTALEQLTHSTASFPTSGLHLLNVRVKANDGNWGVVYKRVIGVDLIPGIVDLAAPMNNATCQIINDTIKWNSLIGISDFEYECATDSNFNTVITTGIVTDTSAVLTNLSGGVNYFWRVRARSGTQVGLWSSIWSFSTVEAVSVTETICSGSTYSFGTQLLTQAGTYSEVFTSVNGCDSTVTLNLSFSNSITSSFSETICGGTSYTFGTQTLSQSGTYNETFTSESGCDSIVTLNLTLLPQNITNLDETVCSGETYTLGTQIYSQTGTYSETFTSVNGCDSTVNLDLTVYVLPITTIDYINGDLVSSSSVDYQWFLDNNELIGANGQSLTPQDNGCYTVVVSDNNCTDTSACYNITNVSVSEYSELKYSISPNPSEGIFYFSSEDFDLNKGIVMDLSGRLLFSIQKNTKIIDMSTLPAGIYILQFETEGVKYQKRLVKQ